MRTGTRDTGIVQKKFLRGIILLLIILAVTLAELSVETPAETNISALTDTMLAGSALLAERLPDFAAETIPPDDSVIQARLEKQLEQKKIHMGQYRLWVHRAKTWFPVIIPILKKNGIPEDFKYIALVESNLSNIVSPRGATGFWQFIPEAGTNYGLEINEFVDERYHVERSTEAACRYFKEAYAMFGNWTLSAASFNIGLGGILKQVTDNDTASYFDMKFNRETSIYIYKLLAMKELMEKPRYYGIIRPGNITGATMRYTLLEVTETTEIKVLAETLGITTDMLRHYNPWLIGDMLPVAEGKTYKIRIPGTNYSPEMLRELYIPSNNDSNAVTFLTDSLKMINFAVRDTGGGPK